MISYEELTKWIDSSTLHQQVQSVDKILPVVGVGAAVALVIVIFIFGRSD